MLGEHYLEDIVLQLGKLKRLAESAMEQIDDAQFFVSLDEETNSIAIVVKHLAGNMRSRWTDFLTTDGEKPDRRRDSEFVIEEGDTRDHLMDRWELGWRLLFDTLSRLGVADLEGTVSIRGEPHSVVEAIDRQLTHYAYHVGQIVLIARHLAGSRWRSLSIPRGKSAEVEVSKTGERYDVSR